MKTWLVLSILAFAVSTALPPFLLITSSERRTRQGEATEAGWQETMHTGGWGPHLRPLMRTDNGVWYAVDEQASLTDNRRTAFYRFDGERWALAGQQEHMPGVQQNCARMYVEPYIWSYGVVPGKKSYLMEAWYRTTKDAQAAGVRRLEIGGKPFELPEMSNYVGGAVSPSGCKMVWYTTVGDRCKNKPGMWSYVYQVTKGGAWVGPVETPLVTWPFSWDAFAYVHASFKDDRTVSIVGQLSTSRCPELTFRAAVAEFAFADGANPFFTPVALPGAAGTSSGDIWVDRRTGDAHVLARAASEGRVAYYYKAGSDPWGGEPKPVTTFAASYRSRFTFDGNAAALHFIKGGVAAPGGVEVRTVKLASIRGAVDWDSLEAVPAKLPSDGFGTPAAIYVQREDQQDTPSEGLFYALCGSPVANPLPHDNLIIHITN